MIVWKIPVIPLLDRVLKRLDKEPFVFTVTENTAATILVSGEYRGSCGSPVTCEIKIDPEWMHGFPDEEPVVDATERRLNESLAEAAREHTTTGHPIAAEPRDVTLYGVFPPSRE